MDTKAAWKQIHKRQNWGGYPSEHVIRFVARNYYDTDRKNVKILDYGCGTGAHTWYLSREGFDTYAFDISPTAIAKLEERMKSENWTANVKVMDGMSLDYPTDFFDAVIDNVSIQSNKISEIQKMYRDVWKVLKKEGRFLTVVFGKETTGYGTGIEIEPGTWKGLTKGNLQGLGHRHFFEKDELEQLLKSAGYEAIVIDTIRYTDKGNVVEQYIAQGKKW